MFQNRFDLTQVEPVVRPGPLKEEGNGADDAVDRVAADRVDVHAVTMRFLRIVVSAGLMFYGSVHLISVSFFFQVGQKGVSVKIYRCETLA